MKKTGYIVLAGVVIVVGIALFFLLSTGNKITCKMDTYIDPGDPKEIELTGVFSKNKLEYVNAKYTFESKKDVNSYCDYYKETEKDVKCSDKTITVKKSKVYNSINDEKLIGQTTDTFKKILEEFGYTCK